MTLKIDLSKRPLSEKDLKKIRKYLLNDSSPDMKRHYRRMYESFDNIKNLLKETRSLLHLWYSAYKYEKK